MKSLPTRIKSLPPRIRRLPSEGGAERSHYQSSAHRQWADDVKKRDGFRCVDCGASGKGVRLIADHVHEIKDGGARLDTNNGQTRCAACSNKKTAMVKALREGTRW